MGHSYRLAVLAALGLSACASSSAPAPAPILLAPAFSATPAVPAPQRGAPFGAYEPEPTKALSNWSKGEALTHGYLGANSITKFGRSGGSALPVEAGGGSVDQYPVIGGGAQLKLAGERLSWGVEGLLSLGGRANGGAFVVGGGGAAVAVSLDMLVLDLYGGPFLSVPIGQRARVYGGAGPVLQFASYHQSATDITTSGSGTGFGVGGYARAGVEFELSPGSLVGFGARWYDTSVDLSGGFGDLDLEGVEAFVSVGVIY